MKKIIEKELKELCFESIETETNYLSLKDLKVTLLDRSVNPYKSMFNMSLMTWGTIGNKWDIASGELRFEVVKRVLEKKALPLALESPSFTFLIENCSRACFDQIARARIGVVYAARGFKDDNLNGLGFLMPSIVDDSYAHAEIVAEAVEKCKEAYKSIQRTFPNWAARCVIPMGSQYSFIMSITYKSLQELCSKRMETTEMEDTVAVAWLLRERVKEVFPLLSEYLRPSSDFIGKDMTAAYNGFSDILGVPHASDRRNPGFELFTGEVKHEEPCTDIAVVEELLGIKIPSPKEWKNYTYETLELEDKILFNG